MESTRSDRRRRAHDVVAPRLAALSDIDLAAMLAKTDSWRAHTQGNISGVIELEDTKVFVKQIALTDLERTAENEGSTANLFGLPVFYQYGVGSAGFGAWRELRAYLRASSWALAGECPYFPVVYHWRVLPRSALPLSDQQLAWLCRAPDYWDHSKAVGARLDAILAASASIVLFLEYVPQTLHGWLADRLSGEGLDAATEARIFRLQDQLRETVAFMNDRGMLHFDLNLFNVLTDGEQIYAADFGLALCSDFDLSPVERAFFDRHRLYDRCYADWALVEWLAPKSDPPTLTPGLRGLVERCAPVAGMFRNFLNALMHGSKSTPYPAAELEAAVSALHGGH